jgi:hypothetical protein
VPMARTSFIAVVPTAKAVPTESHTQVSPVDALRLSTLRPRMTGIGGSEAALLDPPYEISPDDREATSQWDWARFAPVSA